MEVQQTVWLDCMNDYRFYSDTWEFAQVVVLILIVLAMAGTLIHQFRGNVEDAYVNGIATMIKGKRRLSQNVTDTKSRIAEKIDKAAND